MCLISTKALNIDYEIPPLFNDENITVPHFLMELSSQDWRRVKENSIHLNRYTVTKVNKHKIVIYDEIYYGALIKPIKKRSTSQGKPMWSNEINVY